MGQARQSELPPVVGFCARANEAALERVELLTAQGEDAVALGEGAQKSTKFAAAAIEETQCRAGVPASEIGEHGGKFAPDRHRLFRRRRRGRRAQIGGVVDQGPIRLVPDRRDERHKAPRRRAHDDLLVKAP